MFHILLQTLPVILGSNEISHTCFLKYENYYVLNIELILQNLNIKIINKDSKIIKTHGSWNCITDKNFQILTNQILSIMLIPKVQRVWFKDGQVSFSFRRC